MAEATTNIYGINAAGGLADVINFDTALSNLGLDPDDLKKIGNISNTTRGITRDDFFTLSRSDTNLFEKLSELNNATRDSNYLLEKTAGSLRAPSTTFDEATGVSGNMIVNGPIVAPAIRFFSTELMNAAGTDFEPLDISTSRVSSWSRSGNNISYGAELLIDSLGDQNQYEHTSNVESPALHVGSLVIDENENKTEILPREFAAEQATHKLEVRINGKTYYMYAMKNIPLRFRGIFAGSKSEPIVTLETSSGTADFKVIDVARNTSEIQTSSLTLDYKNLILSEKIIEIYINPANLVKLIFSPGLNIENIPKAEYSTLTELDFRNMGLTVMPDFRTITPNLQKLNIGGNPLSASPEGSLFSLNRITQEMLNRLPTGLLELRMPRTFTTRDAPITGDFATTFPSLTALDISGGEGISVASPSLPEVSTTLQTYVFNETDFSALPGTVPIKVLNDSTPLVGSNQGSILGIQGGMSGNANGFVGILRRLKDRFEIEIKASGSGYTNGTFRIPIQGNTLAGVSGAGSPRGIPFGNLVAKVESGVVTAANFSPAGGFPAGHAAGTHNALFDTGPTYSNVLQIGRQFSKVNSPGAGLSLKIGPSNKFRGLGFYTDCGLFSSPMDIRNWFNEGTSSIRGINNRNHAWMNKALTNPHKSYSDNLKQFNFDGCDGAYPPFFNNYTSLETVSMRSIIPMTKASTKQKLDLIYGAGTYDSPTSAEIASMMKLCDSPSQLYKFSGTTNMITMDFNGALLLGKFPRFTGQDKLNLVYLQSTCFHDHVDSTSDTPFGLPLNQFTDASLETIRNFRFTRQNGSLWRGSSYGGFHASKATPGRTWFMGDATSHTSDTQFRYNPAPFQQDSSEINLSGYGKTMFDKLKNCHWIQWAYTYSTKGPLPTFDGTTEGTSTGVYWLQLNHNRFGESYSYTDTKDSNTVKTISGGFLQNWRVPNIRRRLRYLRIYENRLRGTINFQNMANADSTTQNDMTRLEDFRFYKNKLARIDNFGHTKLDNLRVFHGWRGFEDNRSPAEVSADGIPNYFGADKTDGHLIPSLKDKCPVLYYFHVGHSGSKGGGVFKGFADSSTDDVFNGTRISQLYLYGNKFDKSAILATLRSVKNSGRKNVTINFKNQKASDSDGDMDFRNDSIADNDFIEELKRAPYRFSLAGIKSKVIPPAPAAPSTFSQSFTQSGFSSRVTGTTINLGSKEGVFSNWPTGSGIDIRFTISGFATGTDKIVIKKIQHDGDVGQTITINNPTGTITQDFEITTSGSATDINMTDVGSIGTQASSLGASATQTVAFTVQAEGDRGFGSIKTVNLQFKNYTE